MTDLASVDAIRVPSGDDIAAYTLEVWDRTYNFEAMGAAGIAMGIDERGDVIHNCGPGDSGWYFIMDGMTVAYGQKPNEPTWVHPDYYWDYNAD
jgi:hypothetical protein